MLNARMCVHQSSLWSKARDPERQTTHNMVPKAVSVWADGCPDPKMWETDPFGGAETFLLCSLDPAEEGKWSRGRRT
jgi:hypothetical protein